MAAISSRVVVGMSGGVDSSVAALILCEQGYDVIGLFMKNWEEDDNEQYCAAAEDLDDARRVCDQLGIPLETINFSHEYWERVFSHFLDEHRAGRTPNPDVLCNKEIKFKEFPEAALRLGADRIATGHYVRKNSDGKSHTLIKARDIDKDQTYFLYTLQQDALAYSLFPIGELRKHEVRQRARQAGFSIHDKKDSTGICFIGERKFREFLSRYLPADPGEIRDLDGRVLAEHPGLTFFTLGQRHGLSIGGAGEAWFVASKDLKRNILYVVQGHDHPALMSQSLQANQLYWVAGEAPSQPCRCTAKTRYRQDDQVVDIELISDGVATVRFEQAQRAVTPGQSVVFYQADQCLGGGVIQNTQASNPALAGLC